jgi:hypothetical protein
MTQQIIRSEQSLAQPGTVVPMQRLDPFAQGGIAAQPGRLAPLAIVSLGYRQTPKHDGELGLPRATRREDEKWLHLHDPDGRAPGLAEVLRDGAHRRLTIAFPLDEPQAFIQQTFVRWSASALEVYGDATGLRVIDARDQKNPKHTLVPTGHPEFDRIVKTCKAETRIYFALAEWLPTAEGAEPQSRVLFPDGFGFYCFKTSGRHSAAEIIGYLESFRTFTRGRLAGIPFDLVVNFREVVGPDGKKRVVPVGNIVARPPAQTVLDSKTFRVLATAGLEEGRNLQLPALPSPEELAHEGPPELEDDVPEGAVRRLAAGDFPCDYQLVVKTWHAMVRGTPLEADEARAEWLRAWSKGDFTTLTALRNLTQREATQMLADLADTLAEVRAQQERDRRAELAALYDRTIGAQAEAEIPMRQHAVEDHAAEPPPAAASAGREVEEPTPPSASRRPEASSADQVPLDEALAKNTLLLLDAEAIGVKGLRALTATKSDSLGRLEDKNAELLARIRSRNGELDAESADGGRPLF